MSELANVAAAYFKLEPAKGKDHCTHDPREENLEGVVAPGSNSSGKAVHCTTQFKMASSSLAPSEVHVEEHIEDLEKAWDEKEK